MHPDSPCQVESKTIFCHAQRWSMVDNRQPAVRPSLTSGAPILRRTVLGETPVAVAMSDTVQNSSRQPSFMVTLSPLVLAQLGRVYLPWVTSASRASSTHKSVNRVSLSKPTSTYSSTLTSREFLGWLVARAASSLCILASNSLASCATVATILTYLSYPCTSLAHVPGQCQLIAWSLPNLYLVA